MKKNQCIIWLFLLLFAGRMFAQELIPFVVSSSGGFYSNGSGMLSFTIGEMAAVETYTSPAAILTQGFQQSWDFGTYITEYTSENFSFGVYPNPTDGHFQLFTETEMHAHLDVSLITLLGREILHTEFYQSGEINVHPFELRDIVSGMYLIVLSVKGSSPDMENQFVTKIQVIK